MKDEWLEGADLKSLRRAEGVLRDAFVFSLTPEGGDYWWRIIRRLREMADIKAKADAAERKLASACERVATSNSPLPDAPKQD